MTSRRAFLGGGVATAGLIWAGRGRAAQSETAAIGRPLPPWRPGVLDIHHIDTGGGNATFVLMPDGTTLLIDCGAVATDSALSAGPQVAGYARRQSAAATRQTLDYMVATHLHPDHIGDIPSSIPVGALPIATGLVEVDRLMPAALVVDRGFPDYPDPPPNLPCVANHRAWLAARLAYGRRVETARVGSVDQLAPITARGRRACNVRILAANGTVWEDGKARDLLPASARRTPAVSENQLSIALRISYGDFAYFTGGDLTADTQDGRYPWADVEAPVTAAAGRVDVATADHHGYFDACGSAYVRNLDASAYIIQAWHPTHPAMAVLQRLLDAWPGRALRNVYATRLSKESRVINARFVPDLRWVGGHVIVRVEPGGHAYRVIVTDSASEDDNVLFVSEHQAARSTNHPL